MSPDTIKNPTSGPKIKNILAIALIVFIGVVMLSSNISKGPFNQEKGQVLGISFARLQSFFKFNATFSFIFKSEGLASIIQDNLSGKKGEYTIYLMDLTDGENYSMNDLDIFPSASLYKLYLLAAVVNEVENGNLAMDDVVSSKIDHLIDVAGGLDFGYEEDMEQVEYTVEEAMERVARISDNFASIMLAEKITWAKVQDMANQTGAKSTKIKSPITTTSSDIASFLKLLHQKSVVSTSGSEKIIEFLKLNQLNNRIPAGVPEGVEVIHKTGELAGVRHDVGIVYLEGHPYIIVLMSKDLKDENEAIETMAEISKDVYEYFSKKN